MTRIALIRAALALAVLAGGCSLLIDGKLACKSNADCTDGAVCNPSGVCVQAPAPGADGGEADASADASVGADAGADAGPDGGIPDAGPRTCTGPGDCTNCKDGWCCDTPCTSTCQSCNQSGKEGACTPVTAAADDDSCPATTFHICDSNGACKLEDGQDCAAGTECFSTFCVDGKCCNDPCDGECEACNESGHIGTCNPVVSATDPGSCDGTRSCDATGLCVLVGGQDCTAPGQCGTNICVDGKCCDFACTGSCEACNLAGLGGTCSPVHNGPDVGTCSGTQTCDASGACLKATGEPCTLGTECATGSCVDLVCCANPCAGGCQACSTTAGSTANGTCTTLSSGQPGKCTAYLCEGAAACPTSCNAIGQCASGYWCNLTSNLCEPKKPTGQACLEGRECSLGNCVDAFCCDAACAGGCQACSVAAGSSGNGTCATLVSGLGGKCTGGYLCQGQPTCPAACSASGQCDTSHWCNPGTSLCEPKKATGTCILPDECTLGACIDGFCCDAPCSGGCQACSVAAGAAADGQCATLSTGAAGKCTGGFVCTGAADCPAACTAGGSECASGYYCDGLFTCQPKKGTGVSCGSGAECSLGFCVDSFCCDVACGGGTDGCQVCSAALGAAADGTCATFTPPAAGRCGNYACAATCASTCGTSTDCATGYWCSGTACALKKTPGSSCIASVECQQGNCVDGFCCDGACGGGTDGCQVCSTALGASANGTCSTVTAPAAGRCGNYQCAASCPATCTSNSQCAAGSECVNGSCLKLAGQACTLPASCVSASCVAGFCEYGHTLVLDGNNDFTSDETFTTTSVGYTAYLAWNPTNLYVGYSGSDIGTGGASTKWVLVYVDVDPGAATGPTSAIQYNGQVQDFPATFRPDFHFHFRTDGNVSSLEFQQYTTAWSAPAADAGLTMSHNPVTGLVEMSIARTLLGSPAGPVNVVMYLVNELTGSEWTYAGLYSGSFTDGFSDAAATHIPIVNFWQSGFGAATVGPSDASHKKP